MKCDVCGKKQAASKMFLVSVFTINGFYRPTKPPKAKKLPPMQLDYGDEVNCWHVCKACKGELNFAPLKKEGA